MLLMLCIEEVLTPPRPNLFFVFCTQNITDWTYLSLLCLSKKRWIKSIQLFLPVKNWSTDRGNFTFKHFTSVSIVAGSFSGSLEVDYTDLLKRVVRIRYLSAEHSSTRTVRRIPYWSSFRSSRVPFCHYWRSCSRLFIKILHSRRSFAVEEPIPYCVLARRKTQNANLQVRRFVVAEKLPTCYRRERAV